MRRLLPRRCRAVLPSAAASSAHGDHGGHGRPRRPWWSPRRPRRPRRTSGLMNGPALLRVFAPACARAPWGAGCAGVDPQPLFDSLRVDLAGPERPRSLLAARPGGPGRGRSPGARAAGQGELDADTAVRVALLAQPRPARRARGARHRPGRAGPGEPARESPDRAVAPPARRRRRPPDRSLLRHRPARRPDPAAPPEARRRSSSRPCACVPRGCSRTTVAATRVAVAEAIAIDKKVDGLVLLRDLAAAAADVAKRQHAAGNVPDRELARRELAGERSPGRAHPGSPRGARRPRAAAAAAGPLRPRAGLAPGQRIGRSRMPRRSPEQTSKTSPRSSAPTSAPPAPGSTWSAGRSPSRKAPVSCRIGIEVGVSTEKEVDGSRLTGPTLVLELPIFDTGKASVAKLEAEERKARRQLEGLDHRGPLAGARSLGRAARRPPAGRLPPAGPAAPAGLTWSTRPCATTT